MERPSERPGWCLVRTTDRSPPQEGLVPSSALCVSHSRSSVEMDCFFGAGKGKKSLRALRSLLCTSSVLPPCGWCGAPPASCVSGVQSRIVRKTGANDSGSQSVSHLVRCQWWTGQGVKGQGCWGQKLFLVHFFCHFICAFWRCVFTHMGLIKFSRFFLIQ